MHSREASPPGRNAEAVGSRRSQEHREPWAEAQAGRRRAAAGHQSLKVGTSLSFCSLIDTPKHSRGGGNNSHPHSPGEEAEDQGLTRVPRGSRGWGAHSGCQAAESWCRGPHQRPKPTGGTVKEVHGHPKSHPTPSPGPPARRPATHYLPLHNGLQQSQHRVPGLRGPLWLQQVRHGLPQRLHRVLPPAKRDHG